MPLFQKPPSTPLDAERDRPLTISPEEVARMDEQEWRDRAFRGDSAQLTWRAVGMGTVLGFFLAFTNVYVGLKTGWGLGVALTACIVSFTTWTALVRAGIAKTPMTILENNCMQSTASAAGYATATMVVSAVPAMLLLSVTDANPRGTQLAWYVVAPWVLTVAALGVLLAIPMKRSMINRERLKFPSGTAAAVLLQSLYSEGAEALAKGRALLVSGLVGLAVPVLKDLEIVRHTVETGRTVRTTLLPAQSKIFDWLPRLPAMRFDASGHGLVREPYPLSAYNVVLDHSLVLVAAGAIVGLRTTLWMAAGGVLQVFAIAPAALGAEWTDMAGRAVRAASRPGAAWKEIGLWYGAPLMVSHGLVTFALQFKTVGRALTGLLKKTQAALDPSGDHEVPFRWFALGTSVAGTAVAALARAAFDIPLYYGALAVMMTFFLALVACRATGETDITPVSAMGKIMQLTYGVLMPQNYAANLMTASVTGCASAEAADLLNDLKSGYLLGAHPRRQFVAQFLGIFTGTAASVLGYFLLIPDATALTGTADRPSQFAAPAAQQWKAVAELFRSGIGNLHPMAREAIAIGVLAGALLALAEWAFPKERGWVPSAPGIGLGLMLPFFTSLSFVVGAAGASAFTAVRRRQADRFVVPIASGLIAGESIAGVVVAALNSFVLR